MDDHSNALFSIPSQHLPATRVHGGNDSMATSETIWYSKGLQPARLQTSCSMGVNLMQIEWTIPWLLTCRQEPPKLTFHLDRLVKSLSQNQSLLWRLMGCVREINPSNIMCSSGALKIALLGRKENKRMCRFTVVIHKWNSLMAEWRHVN